MKSGSLQISSALWPHKQPPTTVVRRLGGCVVELMNGSRIYAPTLFNHEGAKGHRPKVAKKMQRRAA